MKIGILREGKTPEDNRTPLTPEHCQKIVNKYPEIEIVVQPSTKRSYKDNEYAALNIKLAEDLSSCDVLLGVKEVPIEELIADKIYFFFSHTIKKQAYNKKLLQTILRKNITLIDYEVLTDENNQRLIAFGYFAGMVGAHNGVYTFAKRTGLFDLKRLYQCRDYKEALEIYNKLQLPTMKIVLTGTGRVGKGAARVLDDMGIKSVTPHDFLSLDFGEAVYTQLTSSDYILPIEGEIFDKNHFYRYPEKYKSDFAKFYRKADIFINGIYYDPKSPAFFTTPEMLYPDFNINVIADITCDIAPDSSVPSTLFASTIKDPIFGFNPKTSSQVEPHQAGVIDMMTIDNLPNELPRDASYSFGDQFLKHILPELMNRNNSSVIKRATVTENGQLGENFSYLNDFAYS